MRAAGQASRGYNHYTVHRERLTDGERRLLDEVVQAWAPVAVGSLSDLLVAADPDGHQLLMTNGSDQTLLPVSLDRTAEVRLLPFDVRPDGTVHGVLTQTRDPWPSQVEVASGQSHEEIALPDPVPADLHWSTTGHQVLPRMFQGRAPQLAVIDAVIDAPPRGRRPIVVYGSRRSGKTTLAHHALEVATDAGRVAVFVTLDLSGGVGFHGDDEANYPPQLTKDLRRRLRRALRRTPYEVEVDAEITDPIEFLEELDDEWGPDQPPLGILLDEFDAIFHRPAGSPLYGLVERFANLQTNHLVLLGTVQRHGAAVRGLKEWTAVPIDANLGAPEAYGYFLRFPTGEARVAAIDRPLVTPQALRHQVVARLSFRPYFWGQLYGALERRVADPGTPRLLGTDAVRTEIDQILESDLFFSSLLADLDDDNLAELMRKDTFTVAERRLLAVFSRLDEHVDHVDESHVRKVFDGDLTAVARMREREMVKVLGQQIRLDPPCLLEWARAHRIELDRYL